MARTTKKPAVKKEQTFTLTKEQFLKLRDIYREVVSIRENLEELKGEDDLSTIMFAVGSTSHQVNECEDQLNDIVYSFEFNEWEEDEDEDF
jgi:hypothetical protein